MNTAQQDAEKLRRATFRIYCIDGSGHERWGSAFFISATHALTAFHNLPALIGDEPTLHILGYKDNRTFELVCLRDNSLATEFGDIAVLQLAGNELPKSDFLLLGVHSQRIDRQSRLLYWAGRPICILGFPVEYHGQAERLTFSNFDSTQPIVEADVKTPDWRGVRGAVDFFRIPDSEPALMGMSGAPILDRESGLVVGVEHSHIEGLKVVYGTEVAGLRDVWPGLRECSVDLESTPSRLPHSRSSASPPVETLRGLLPPFPRIVIGRETELTKLRTMIEPPVSSVDNPLSRVVVLRGWPGVGKTTTVATLAHDPQVHSMFPNGVLWASLGQIPDLLPIVDGWMSALGERNRISSLGTDQALGVLRSLLADKHALLIIDDVWNISHAEALRAGGKFCVTLFTTRETAVANSLAAPGQAWVLPVLPTAQAMDLLIAIAAGVVARYPAESLSLIEDLQGLPLAIHVAASLLMTEAALGFSVSDLLGELREGTRLLNSAAPADRTTAADQTIPSVAALLDLSTRRLSDAERYYFMLLGVFAPKPATFDSRTLSDVWELEDVRPTVRALADRGLLEPLPGTRFQMHSLLAMHARWLASRVPA